MVKAFKKNIVIIGASGHAKVIIDMIEDQNEYVISGLIDSFKPVGTKVFDYEVLGTEDDLKDLSVKNNIIGGVIAIGDNYSRFLMYMKITKQIPKFKWPQIIHKSAVISKKAIVSEGTVIIANTVVNAAALIGKGCLLNTDSTLGHDSKMSDFSSLAPGVNIGGNVSIGTCSAIGIGSSVIGNLEIGEHTFVGAGSVVVKSINAFKMAYGVPAKEIRDRLVDENHLI